MAKTEKSEKKEKREKHSSKDGVHKSKKDSAKTVSPEAAEALVAAIQENAGDSEGKTRVGGVTVPITILKTALVPFANPLVDDKTGKKVLKGVKRSAKARTLKRGVKEVVKALRKSSEPGATPSSSEPHFVCVLAADISPMDVISHLPVLCEDHAVPYAYVPSRAELGAAGQTKRPTSVVLVGRDIRAKKGAEVEGDEEWKESYAELVKVVKKLGRDVKM